jgi:hypothetical protein
MTRINEGVEPKPLPKEIPPSTFSPPPDQTPPQGAVAPEDVPYFDGSNPNKPGMTEDDLAEQILQDVLGQGNGN